MIFESHAHYDDESFAEDRRELITAVFDAGVFPVVNVASTVESVNTTLELAGSYEGIYAAVGVHPEEIAGLTEENFPWLREMAQQPKVVAIGEIGLDYYWEKDPARQEIQRYWLGRQLDMAWELGLPVIIHSREAAADTLEVIRAHHGEEIRGVVHCYSYSPEMALEYIRMGWYIGVGGVVTFKNSKKLRRTVEAIPADRILTETDCPYMAPEPHRGTRNDSRNIRFVIDKIAELKGISPEEAEKITEENGYRFFDRMERKNGKESGQ